MDIRFKNEKLDIINILDDIIKVKRHGSENVEILEVDKIDKVEILDHDELIIYHEDKEFFRGVFEKEKLKSLSKFYEKINKEKYDLPGINLDKIIMFSMQAMRFIFVALLCALLIKNYMKLSIFTTVSIILITIMIKIFEKRFWETKATNKFYWFEDFVLTGNYGILIGLLFTVFGLFFGMFMYIL